MSPNFNHAIKSHGVNMRPEIQETGEYTVPLTGVGPSVLVEVWLNVHGRKAEPFIAVPTCKDNAGNLRLMKVRFVIESTAGGIGPADPS
jgi:hypothetical protein